MRGNAGPASQKNGKGYRCMHVVRDMSASLNPYCSDACHQNGLPSTPHLPLPSTIIFSFSTNSIARPYPCEASCCTPTAVLRQVYHSHVLFMALLHTLSYYVDPDSGKHPSYLSHSNITPGTKIPQALIWTKSCWAFGPCPLS